MPETTIAEIDKQLPALERILAAEAQAEPHITALLAIGTKVWPDIVAVRPLIQELVAFYKSKQA
jgi:hypothetical protein